LTGQIFTYSETQQTLIQQTLILHHTTEGIYLLNTEIFKAIGFSYRKAHSYNHPNTFQGQCR